VSLLLLFRSQTRAAVETLASPDVTIDDLRRLEALLARAATTNTTRVEVTIAIEQDVPTASPLAALLRQGATPLATWLSTLLAAIGIVLLLRERDPAPAITPEVIQEIANQAVAAAQEAQDKGLQKSSGSSRGTTHSDSHDRQ
jgi:hypothetical protein